MMIDMVMTDGTSGHGIYTLPSSIGIGIRIKINAKTFKLFTYRY